MKLEFKVSWINRIPTIIYRSRRFYAKASSEIIIQHTFDSVWFHVKTLKLFGLNSRLRLYFEVA